MTATHPSESYHMTPPELPEAVQPSAEAIARDQQLAARQQAILDEVAKDSGNRIKIVRPRQETIQYGPNREILAHTINGVSQLSREEQAIRRAQSTHNAQLSRMENDHKRIIAQRDALRGYDPEGKPLYVQSAGERERLTRLARGLEFSMVGQGTQRRARAWAALRPSGCLPIAAARIVFASASERLLRLV